MRSLGSDLAALAAHLGTKRGVILQAWRDAVRRDPLLTSGDALPRAQLNDHIPAVLAGFEQELAHPSSVDVAPADANQNAAAHGLNRWQQGYDLREVVRELGRLNVCVVAELEAYAKGHPDLHEDAMPIARRLWAACCSVGIEESTAQYTRLQKAEAAGHVADLEKALEQMRELEQQRADLWREAAHDLRGTVGVVSNATAGLAMGNGGGAQTPGASSARSELFLRMLQRNVTSLHHLLDDVTDLARLQAGQEKRQIGLFDAGTLLTDLCEGLLPMAQERGLTVRCSGPAPFAVQGDEVKTRRLAQNLVLNALKYTRVGGVTVTWGDSRDGDAQRWMISVQDTGPGFDTGPGAPLAGALEEATHVAHDVDAGSVQVAAPDLSGLDQAIHRPVQRPGTGAPGEGIGLSIVKRLTELLDASVELDSSATQGTEFRIFLPRQYAVGTA